MPKSCTRLYAFPTLVAICVALIGSPARASSDKVAKDLIVQFKPQATQADENDANAQAEVLQSEEISTAPMKAAGKKPLKRVKTRLPLDKAIEKLSRHPAVEFVEPNWIYTHQAAANDTYYLQGYLWGMYGAASNPKNTFGSEAVTAWASGATGSKTVYVGVIDEGIQISHPDLRDNAWTNSYDPPDGIDNDGNGYVDDVNGWNFYGNNNAVFDTNDFHGTHVTGTIGAKGGNSIGVAGVNWNVTFISGKFLGPDGGTTTDAIRAIDYFTDLKTRHHMNIVALNNSWGGGGYSQALQDAILRAAKADILFVVAAGNGDANGNGLNNDVTPDYPSNYDTTKKTTTEPAASYDAVISVAAIDSSGARATFSNYGAKSVDLGAPGVNILSTAPMSSYAMASGTSMATPHVTGAIALYASLHPGEKGVNIKTALLMAATNTPTPSLAGVTVTGGRLNLASMLANTSSSQPPLTDSDQDGIPDAYETGTGIYVSDTNTGTNPNNPDSDGDGVKDGDELTAGTNPNSKTDVLRIQSVRPVANGMALRFSALTNHVYQVYSCNQLGVTNSLTPVPGLTNITVTANSSIEVTDTSAKNHTNCFYRLLVRKP